MPTFKGLIPNTFLTPTFWVLNWFLSFILCYYWVVQAHLQRFRVFEVFWCHGIIKNSHLCCLHSAIVSFPSGKWVGWSRAADGSLYRRQKAFMDWDEVLCSPLLQQVQQHWPLFKATSEPNPVISTELPASVGKMKSLSSYKYTGDPHITLAIFRSLRMRVQISFHIVLD